MHDDKNQFVEMLSSETSTWVINETHLPESTSAIFSKFRDLELEAYIERTPYAVESLRLLRESGAKIVNDHVALRTFRDLNGTSGKDIVEQVFLAFGYRKEDNINIESLRIQCHWYEPPASTNWPKVFISEQQICELPVEAQQIVSRTIGDYFSSNPLSDLNLERSDNSDPRRLYEFLETPPWNPTSIDYLRLITLSSENPDFKSALQYTAWTLVHGHRWNHFTVLLNTLGLDGISHLEDLNSYLKDHGLPLNNWKGVEIQGSEERLLKQSSTTANMLKHRFADGVEKEVPGSFVEFIERFTVDGVPFRGFIADNARGIFASTDASR